MNLVFEEEKPFKDFRDIWIILIYAMLEEVLEAPMLYLSF